MRSIACWATESTRRSPADTRIVQAFSAASRSEKAWIVFEGNSCMTGMSVTSADYSRSAGTSVNVRSEHTSPATAEQTDKSTASAKKSRMSVQRNRVSLWHGLDAGGMVSLLRLRPELNLRNADRLLGGVLMSGANSLLNAVSSLIYGRRVAAQKLNRPPLFILGHWRSGTTMLHNLLTLNPELGFLNLYQCLNPGHFLLTEKVIAPLTEWMLSSTRPMDNMPLSWSLPQEDEMGLCVSTLLSPYIMIAFQDRMDVYERFFDPRDMTPKEQQVWKSALLSLLQKFALRSDQTPVMKSPTHTFRVPTLMEMFPQAKFVYIHRNPRDVIRSTVRLREVLFTENSIGPLHPECWLGQTVDVYERCIRSYENAKHLIPGKQLVEIGFEDLEANPGEVVHRIHRELDLGGWEKTRPLLTSALAEFADYRKNSFRPDAEMDSLVRTRLAWVCELYGYEVNKARVA